MTLQYTATVSEGQHAGGYIVSEANKTRSRENITIAGGVAVPRVLVAGTVLAKLSTGEYLGYDPDEGGPPYDIDAVAGILFDDVTAPVGTEVSAVAHVRDCEVNEAELVWPDGITDEQVAAAHLELIALGIIPRAADELE